MRTAGGAFPGTPELPGECASFSQPKINKESFPFLVLLYLYVFVSSRFPFSYSLKMAPEAGRQKVVVVGAGPVGALAALHAAVRGDDVEIYELRGGKRIFDSSFVLLFYFSMRGL